jgi:hypothetical protein
MANPTGVMDAAVPWGAAIGAVGQALATPPAGPSDAKSAGSIGTNLDTSGWNVSYGDNSDIDARRNQSAPGVSASGGSMPGPGLMGGASVGSMLAGIDQNMVMLGVLGLVVLKLMRRKHA